VDDLWATKSEDVGLICRAISFQDFQPMWSQFHQRYRRTDRRHCDRNYRALHFKRYKPSASRAEEQTAHYSQIVFNKL